MRNGPIAKPNFSMAPSTCSTLAPSSSICSACAEYWLIMRLPMKPSQTPDTTAVLRIFLASAMAVASTSGAVFAPRTTSSSRITLAGLKKCRPMTSAGRAVKPAMWSTSSVEVLVARMAPGFATASSCRKTFSLTPMSSNTASMTRSTAPRSA